jgi:hypothetical protein
MTEEAQIVEVNVDDSKATPGDYVPEIAIVDVDASWDGKGSLDEHRQKELAKVKQPGFGDAGKAKSNGE